MRAVFVQDGWLAVAIGQDFKHALNVGTGVAAGELPVAECARAAFTEEVIALRVERPARIERADIGDAILHLAPALQHERAISREREHVSREQARGTRADD